MIPAGVALLAAWLLRRRPPPLWLILPALLIPAPLLSHALSPYFLPWAGSDKVWLCYDGVLFLKLCAPAFLLLRFLPPLPWSSEFLWKKNHPRLVKRILWEVARLIPPFLILYVLAWQDFELASRLNVPTWTVRLFDAHAGGLSLSASWRAAFPPLLGMLALVSAAFFLGRGAVSAPSRGRFSLPAAVLLLTPLIPVLRLFPAAAGGWSHLIAQPPLLREIFASAVIGVACGSATWLLGGFRSWWRWPLAALGLCGALPLGLSLLRLFQTPPLLWARDTPLPLMMGLTVNLFPLTLLLRFALLPGKSPETFLAVAAPSSRALAVLKDGPAALGCYLLILAAFLELTLSDLLAPPAWSTAAPRLYNLMHYGESPVLNAMILTVYLAPLAFLPVWLGASRWLAGRRRA